jgi:hypothetical protein
MSNSETTVEWSRSELRATATQRFGKREVRCQIRHKTWSPEGAKISFGYRYPDSNSTVGARWTPTAGPVSGPKRLQRWKELFAVFEAALEAYVAEIAGPVSDGQIEPYERANEGAHPIFEIPDSPDHNPIPQVPGAKDGE